MELILNGETRRHDGSPDLSVLTWLRDVMGLISPKDGCSGEGVCGCCDILVDGVALPACKLEMRDVEGKTLTTMEGFSRAERDAFADAFVLKGGVQCGFCTPGVVVKAKALLNKKPDPSREEIAASLNANICRCTGYKKIVDSIECAAEALRTGKPVAPARGTGRVGTRHAKYTAREAVLGERVFVADMKEPGMLYGALRFSDHPRAKVLRIDVSPALEVPGVERVLTAKEVPGKRFLGSISQDWPVLVAEGETTCFVGDVLATVAATSEKAAREAAAKIEVEYEVLSPVTDIFEALEPESPIVNVPGNVLHRAEVKVGDAEEALSRSAYVTRNRFVTQRIEHAFLEPEATLALPWQKDGKDGVKVYSCSQGVYEDRHQLSLMLGVPKAQVNVVQVQNGGGFGGKEDITTQSHAALLAWLTGKPAMVHLSRKDSLRMHAKRHPFVMDYAVGCDEAGKLTALVATLHSDTGAYASVGLAVIERAVSHSAGAYFVPNVRVQGKAVVTNNAPCGAFRGFGVNQSNFAFESCLDELCRIGGFDRWKFRWENALTEGKTTATGQVLKAGVGVRKCLEAVKDRFYSAKYAGLAAGMKNTGIGCGLPDFSHVKIVVRAADHVEVHHGWCEMGQGNFTMAVQTVVEETGIDPALVDVKVETDEEAEAGMTTGSRGTSLLGLSVKAACQELKKDLASGKTLEDLVGKEYRGSWVCDWTVPPGKPPKLGHDIVTHYSFGFAAQLVELDESGKITRITAAHDAGKIMNPTLFEGQIEGALHMGLGYALTEEFPYENGWPVSFRMADLGIIKAKDMPPTEVIGIEVPDAVGPYGAKGVGEIGLVPTAPAVANALCQLDGIRRTKLPLREPKTLGKKVAREIRKKSAI
jgi:xanthine dehydrogenase molybdenum-binding subunit